MQKLIPALSSIGSRQIPIIAGGVIVVLIILDLLATRQILYLNNTSEIVLFILTVIGGYGICSWILLEYTRRITANLRSKSSLTNVMHWAVTIVQFSMFAILLYVLVNNTVNCYSYFSECTNVRPQTTSVYVITSIGASVIMGIIGFKFFSWYKINKRNFMVLFYGLAAVTFAIAIAEDAYTKLVFIHVLEEKTPLDIPPQASFIYKTIQKYNGEIQYKVVNPVTTTLWVLPSSLVSLKNSLDYLAALPYIFTWLAVATLLRKYYQSIRPGKFPIKFWIMLSVPLVLYLVGSGLIISLPADIPYRFYIRLIFRAGTIGSSVLFGLAYYIATKNLPGVRVKDYLVISALGIIPIGIANEISALQQTFGVAAHSFVFLSSYLFSIGLYSLAISVSQDSSLRKSIRTSTMQVFKLLDIIGTPQMGEEIERRVLNNAKEEQSVLLKRTGVEPSLTEEDMKHYLGTVLKEVKILKNIDEILKKGKDILNSSNDFIVCSGVMELRLVYNNHFNIFRRTIEKYKNGEHKGIKIVTTISDQDSAELIKKFLDIGVQVRHIDTMPPIDFAVSDKEMIATTEKTGGGGTEGLMIRKLLVTNEQAYISHFVFIFNELWKDAIDARERILTIEQGIEPEFVKVISDTKKAKMILIDLVKSVKKEALFILPNDIGMIRADRMGLIDHLINASQDYHAVVKIICPLSKQNSDIVKRISNSAPDIQVLNGNVSSAGMFIVDGKKYFRAELKDSQNVEFDQAIAFPIYSNSKHSVDSFRSIFEVLWNERVLNEELKGTEVMQKEFINIAAHELRNPIQPILGLSDNLLSHEKGDINEYREQLNIIYRNAKRLQRLTEDILDVSKIEGQILKLNKSRFNLKEVIINAMADFKTQLESENKLSKIKLDFVSREDEDIFTYADPDRITQVISNLLSNAFKFTEEGSITITMNRVNNSDSITSHLIDHKDVIVSVRDTGKGIHPSIKGKLFDKFETRSGKGIGLGLYISRNIIEAHDGKIWVENNVNEKGTTFFFTLSVVN
ncbi:MAG TPA: HAMP domain-containing sensor histidine kinase [Nitrososphaeraceae archaeon]|jgi:signal transduction histidine kinase